jgi:glutamate transport system substrate-binding protein
MTNKDVSQEEQLRAVLGRYQERFEPAQPDWVTIEACQRSRRRARGNRAWRNVKLTTLAIVLPVLAAVVIVVNIVPVSIDFGQSRAQARSAPAAPSYRPVFPRPSFAPGSTMAVIGARGFIRVGVKSDQPGFGFKDATGRWSGFDVEIAKLMAAGIFGGDINQVQSKIVFVPVISADREAELQAGTVDIVIATYTITAARQQSVDFVGPYFRAEQDIMVKADNVSIKGVSDLDGRKVCTVGASTSYQNLLVAAPAAEITLVDTYSACARQLEAGRVDAVTTDNVILAGLVHEHGFIFKLVNSPFSDEPYGIGLKKGDATLRAFLTDRLAAIEADGDWTLAQSYALQGIQGFTPPPIN